MDPLRFDAYRQRRWAEFTAAEQALLERYEGDLEEAEEFDGAELVDLFDGDRATHLLALWPFGSGVLVDLATGEPVADIVQHWFDAHGGNALRAAVQAAFAEGKPRLGIRESIDFSPGKDSPKPAPRAPAGDDVLDRIRAMRRGIADGALAAEDVEIQKALWALVDEVLDRRTWRPLPVRRPFQLSQTEREVLELVEDGAEQSVELWTIGLPNPVGRFWRRHNAELDPGGLGRFLGRAPAGLLDEPIEVDGQPHPAWCLLSDAVYGDRDEDSVLDLLAALPTERAVAIARAMAREPSLLRVIVRDAKQARKGTSVLMGLAHQQRFVVFAVRLFERLGDAGEAGARASLEARAGWATIWGPKLQQNPMLSVPYWIELCVLYAVLARRARARGGALDPVHDETLREMGLSRYTWSPLEVVLDELPLERAGRIAAGQLELVARYPTEDSAEGAMRLLETWVDSGSYTRGTFLNAIQALGELARPHLVAARARLPDKVELVDAALAKLDKAAKKKKKKR